MSDESLDAVDARITITRAIRLLPERERAVLVLRFGLDGQGERPLADISAVIGVGKVRVSQLLYRALRWMHWLLHDEARAAIDIAVAERHSAGGRAAWGQYGTRRDAPERHRQPMAVSVTTCSQALIDAAWRQCGVSA